MPEMQTQAEVGGRGIEEISLGVSSQEGRSYPPHPITGRILRRKYLHLQGEKCIFSLFFPYRFFVFFTERRGSKEEKNRYTVLRKGFLGEGIHSKRGRRKREMRFFLSFVGFNQDCLFS